MQTASWAPLTAFVTTLLIIWWFVRSRLATIVLDHPGSRSLHQAPVPRTGGLGLFIGALFAIGIIAPDLPLSLWVALGVLILVSFLEDVRGVSVLWRLLAHLAAAGIFAVDVLGDYGYVITAAATLAIAWMINLYNFMDGADGLAGGMTLIGFAFFGAAAWHAGNIDFALMNFSIASAAAAFLVFNFHPARIFMGDTGPVPLGFLAATLGTAGWLQGDWAWWFPALVFSPFIVDASVTLAKRALRLERVWEAHRNHYYQWLVRIGLGHRKTAFLEYAMMLACGTLGLVALPLSPAIQMSLLAGVIVVYAVLILALERAWHHFAGKQ